MTWGKSTVRRKSETIAESAKLRVEYHFGKLMALCHSKHSELSADKQSYKGRIVFKAIMSLIRKAI